MESANNTKLLLSEVTINSGGELCEVVDFGTEIVEYKINGVTEHIIYGIFFSFNQKSESK
jgi:hypothetical protein